MSIVHIFNQNTNSDWSARSKYVHMNITGMMLVVIKSVKVHMNIIESEYYWSESTHEYYWDDAGCDKVRESWSRAETVTPEMGDSQLAPV